MKSLIILVVLLIAIALYFPRNLYYTLSNDSAFQAKVHLSAHEKKVLRRYLNAEYETAQNYLDDDDVTHYFLLDSTGSVLITYLNITKQYSGHFAINYMYTNPSYRGQGLMGYLFDFALSQAKSSGISTVYSWTTPSNVRVLHKFHNAGFTIIDTNADSVSVMKNL